MEHAARTRRAPRLAAALVGALALTAPAGGAFAACARSDLTAMWQLYGMFVDDAGANWFRRKLSVGATGTINQSVSSCATDEGSAGSVSGSLKLTNTTNCTVTGSLKVGGTTTTVKHATLSKDKLTLQGVTTSPGAIGVFTGTKI
jgi:hypothetical protein